MYQSIKTWWKSNVEKARDPNMADAIQWGQVFIPPLELSLKQRVNLVEFVEEKLPGGCLRWMTTEQRAKFYQVLEKKEDDRVLSPGTLLRLWGGCIIGAKVIAIQTRTGITTRKMRERQSETADEWTASDSIVHAGMEAAPLFKFRRGESINYHGVKKWHVLRNYKPDQYEGSDTFTPFSDGKNKRWIGWKRDDGAEFPFLKKPHEHVT